MTGNAKLAQMQMAVSTISKAADEFRTAAANTVNAANTLADQWEGESQTAFAEEKQKANDLCIKMTELLDNYVTRLNHTMMIYSGVDKQTVSFIRGH